MKVIVIEEAQDITSMKVDKLFGSLLTFEMSLDRKPEKKNKEISLQSLLKKSLVSLIENTRNFLLTLSLCFQNNLIMF